MILGKRGWIRIVEASIAILFITGVILVVINSNELESGDEVSLKILEEEISMLREIQLNNSLREEVLSVSSFPVESGEAGFPQEVEDKINSSIPNYLECALKICSIDSECILTTEISKSIYAESVLITTIPESSSYSPRKLKIFCWRK
jgi:hypothetical protein